MRQNSTGFSILELMVVVSIIAVLAVIVVPSYRDYTLRATIASLMPIADKVKNEVEDAHNQGTIFGTSGNQTYIASSAPDKPYGLLDLTRVAYGCVNISIDTAGIGLEAQTLTLAWCPTVIEGSVQWQCGYAAGSYADYVQYLPAKCQVQTSTIQDTNF